jgi:SulP family sulfate permease
MRDDEPSPGLPVTEPAQGAGPQPSSRRPSRADLGRLVARYLPITVWLPSYDHRLLRPDLIAGIVGWGVMVPVSMAYAGLAGVAPEAGLVTAFAAMAAYAVLGTSRHLKVTASSAIALMSASVIATVPSGANPSVYVSLTAALALVVGGILLVAGIAGLGFLSQFLAKSVVTGFVIGLAIVITIGQIPGLLGIPGGGATVLQKLATDVGQLPDANPWTVALGLGSLVLIFACRRFAPKIPGPLLALVIGIAAVQPLDLTALGVDVVGEIETGIPAPDIPSVSLNDLAILVTGAFGIVFLALAESLGAARIFATRSGYEIDPDQELIALGAANLSAGVFGGFAVDASMSQSATGEAAGVRTQLSSLVTSGLVLLTALVLAPLFKNLPQAVLSAIVISSAVGLIDVSELRRYLRWRRTDFLLAMTALIGVVLTTALVGMAIAVTLSLLAILYQASRPYIAQLGRLQGKPTSFGDIERHPTARRIPGLVILRPNVPLTFVNASVAKDQIIRLVRAAEPRPSTVILDISATADLDVATIDMLNELLDELRRLSIQLVLAQVRGTVRDRMRRTGLMEVVGEDRVFQSVSTAVEAATRGLAPQPERAADSSPGDADLTGEDDPAYDDPPDEGEGDARGP